MWNLSLSLSLSLIWYQKLCDNSRGKILLLPAKRMSGTWYLSSSFNDPSHLGDVTAWWWDLISSASSLAMKTFSSNACWGWWILCFDSCEAHISQQPRVWFVFIHEIWSFESLIFFSNASLTYQPIVCLRLTLPSSASSSHINSLPVLRHFIHKFPLGLLPAT